MTAFVSNPQPVQANAPGLQPHLAADYIGRTANYAGLLLSRRGCQMRNTFVPAEYRNPAKLAKDSEHILSVRIEKEMVVDAHWGQYRVFLPDGKFEEWVK